MPKLRLEEFYDLQSLVGKAVETILKDKQAYQTCLVCERFNENTEICQLANARPPARVIAYGCPQFIDKEQPPF